MWLEEHCFGKEREPSSQTFRQGSREACESSS